MVTAEIALSVTLLAGAGLLLKTMRAHRRDRLGFQRRSFTGFARARSTRRRSRPGRRLYYRELQTRLAALPGVRSIALASSQPLTGLQRTEKFEIPGRGSPAEAEYRVITPDYFATLGIPIHRGRAFDPRDDHRAVISESLARKYWPGEDPIGKLIRVRRRIDRDYRRLAAIRAALCCATPRRFSTARGAASRIARSNRIFEHWGDPLTLARSVTGVVARLGGVVAEVYRGRQFIEDATWQQKQSARILSVFAGLALALAAAGLYGVISLAIGRRTREIGIRMAIGAKPSDVAGLVLRQSVSPVLAGLALGLGGRTGDEPPDCEACCIKSRHRIPWYWPQLHWQSPPRLHVRLPAAAAARATRGPAVRAALRVTSRAYRR